MQKITREYENGLLIKETVIDDTDVDTMSSVLKALGDAPSDAAAYQVIKSEEPQKFTLGVAYAANKIDVGKGVDQHIDFVSAEALEQCAWNYLAKGAQIGMFHADGTEGHATVVESYIYRGPDWTVGQENGKEYVIKAGDWMLGAIWDDFGFDLVMKEMIRGWSPQGQGRRRTPTAEALNAARARG